MQRLSLLVWLSLVALAARADETKTYAVHGTIERIAPDRTVATIHNQTIPGYMMEMTMDFPVKNTNELAGFSAGDEIDFQLVVASDHEWIQKLQLVAHHVSTPTNGVFMIHEPSAELKPGDMLPDCVLTAETGRTVRVSDFHGRAVAFTFFFTRCPLPDFCPRMNNNFAQTRDLLRADIQAPTNWQFISISFDPGFDTPETLANYGALYRHGDPDRWLFASAPKDTLAALAPRLDLMVMRQGAGISHNLRTVVLDVNGRISRQFDGNNWTPRQLADALAAAARVPLASHRPDQGHDQ